MRITHRSIPFWFLILSCLILSRFSYGFDFEASNSTNCIATSSVAVIPRTDPGDVLGSVLINQRAANSETLKIYDSSGTATNLIGTIDLSTGTAPTGGPNYANEFIYNMRVSSGVTISKSGSSSDLTIIWKNIR